MFVLATKTATWVDAKAGDVKIVIGSNTIFVGDCPDDDSWVDNKSATVAHLYWSLLIRQ